MRKNVAVNVGEAVAHLTLDTSEFKKALNGAGKDLEILCIKLRKKKLELKNYKKH